MHGFSVSDDGRFIEGPPDAPVMRKADEATLLLEACIAARVRSVLLYPSNLTAQFFDLSSGEAGTVLQKVKNYQLRLAVVCAPGSVRFSSRFGEITAEVRDFFRLFETAEAAREWLRGERSP